MQRLHGRDDPPPELRWLRAGPLDVALDGPDLRYVRLGELELVRRVYLAVRDLNWDTIGDVQRNVSIEEGGDDFVVRGRLLHRRGPIVFAWDGLIEGSADGTITYTADGRCESEFPFAKIGICVHHPIRECAGRPFAARTPDGPVSGVLPDTIGQQIFDSELGYELPLFAPFSALAIDLDGGIEVSFAFEGQLFEMEDQRNWTDASLKTASMPSYLGFVHQAEPGRRVWQRVVIRHRARARAGPVRRRGAVAPPEGLILGRPLGRTVPPIGFGLPSDGQPHSPVEVKRVRALRPAHLRADIDAEDVLELNRAFEQCAAVDARLELALHVDANDLDAVDRLCERVPAGAVARLIVLERGQETTRRAVIEAVRARLPNGLPLVGGTNAYFCDINRDRPDVTALDGVAYSINSQVHAVDELSLVEALDGHADTVISACAIFPAVPIVVSPITLRPRFNPVAVAEELTGDGPELPWPVDPRQMSQFAAAWTLGSVKALSEAGASSLTYYETVGWRGLFEREAGNPQPDLFPSTPGMLFPVYGLFAALAGLGGAELVELTPTDPLRATGLALHSAGELRLLLANLTPEPTSVEVSPRGLTVDLDPYGVEILTIPAD
jgi:hypothetical protein